MMAETVWGRLEGSRKLTAPTESQKVLFEADSVIAVVVRRHGRVGLFKRSSKVQHNASMWHCITGYIPDGISPEQQALAELHEETGLGVTDIKTFTSGNVLKLLDAHGGRWTVNTFHCETDKKDLVLNWEHDHYRWVRPRTIPRFAPVPWFHDVMQAASRPT